MQAINHAGEVLDADLFCSFVESDDSNQLNNTFEYEYDDPQLVLRNSRCLSKSILSTSVCSTDQRNFQTLKKRVPTRWNTFSRRKSDYQGSNRISYGVRIKVLSYDKLMLIITYCKYK